MVAIAATPRQAKATHDSSLSLIYHLIKFLCGLLIKKHVVDGDVMDPEEVRANVSLIFADLLPEDEDPNFKEYAR